TLGRGQDVVSQTDQSAGRNVKFQVLEVAFWFHYEQLALTLSRQFDYFAGSLLRNVYYQGFDRLAFHTIDVFEGHLWLAYLQFIAFSSHRLDQDRQVKDTSSVYQEFIFRLRGFYSERQVLFGLFHQTVTQVTGGHKLAFSTEERGVVDREEHVHRRLIDADSHQCLRVVCVREGVADLKIIDTSHCANISRECFFNFIFAKTFKCMKLFYFHFFDRAVSLHQGYLLVFFDRTSLDTADCD